MDSDVEPEGRSYLLFQVNGTMEDNDNHRIMWENSETMEGHGEKADTNRDTERRSAIYMYVYIYICLESLSHGLPGGASGLFGLITTLAPPPKTAAHMRLLSGCAARRKSSLLL